MAHILIIDDQPAILKMIESILQSGGHTVVTAVDGMDGLEKAERGSFELIVTDAVMPGGVSGYDVVRTLRKRESTAMIPIILLTGNREKKDVEKGIKSGVDDYIVKPVEPDVFLAKIKSLLEKKPLPAPTPIFTDVGVLEDAQFLLRFSILGVSEIGMTIRSPHPLHPQSSLHIQSEFFKKVGIESPKLQVVECKPFEGLYLLRVEFVDLTEKSLKPLRQWLRQNQVRSAS